MGMRSGFWSTALRACAMYTCVSAAFGPLAACVSSEPASPPFVETSAAELSLEAAISNGIASKRYPGAVYLVSVGDRLVFQASLGVADIDTNAPMQRDSVFRAMSMTKPVTAVAVMMLVDEGKLQLDQPVSKYLPEFGDARGEADGQPRVTLWHLLTHTGGGGFGGIPVGAKSLEERTLKVASLKPSTPPGARWAYSAVDGFDVLARVVEVVSGQRYETFLKEHLFDPLGMKDTTYTPDANQKARTVGLYAAKNGVIAPDRPPFPDVSYPSGGAGLYTTGPDTLRLAQMLANDGALGDVRILKPSTVREMSRAQLADGFPGLQPGLAWGLGVRRVENPQNLKSPLPAGAFGWSGAYGTHFWVDPRRKLAAVWMINLTNAGGAGSPDALEFERLVMTACDSDPRCSP